MFPAIIQNLGETGQPLESKYRQATCLWFMPVVHQCGACVQTGMYSLHALTHWCTQAHPHPHPQTFTHTLAHTHMHSPTNTHTFTCTHTHLHTHTHTHSHITKDYMGTSHRCVHTHAHTQAGTYTHTHTLTHSVSLFIPSLNRDAFLWEIQRCFPSTKLYYPACCWCLTLAKFL